MSAKVKIDLQERVIEIEGSIEFVERQIDNLENIVDLIERLDTDDTSLSEPNDIEDIPASEEVNSPDETNTSNDNKNLSVPTSFGEWMHRFQETLTDQERALIAAYYVQNQSNENDFKTSEVTKCLKDHAIKLANPSNCLNRLASKKLTFQTRKVGSLKYRRVSREGEKHLKKLLR
ncbi:MAG: hypothetical protein CL608_04815 [Anaerolineaceae bacterium]|nr:hypothetical protein [Anaerolineaceae bacterium]